MRLTNEIRDTFTINATRSIFKKDIEEYQSYISSKVNELIDLFKSSEYYKRGRKVYLENKEYCLPYTKILFKHGFHFRSYCEDSEYLKKLNINERIMNLYRNYSKMSNYPIIDMWFTKYIKVEPFAKVIKENELRNMVPFTYIDTFSLLISYGSDSLYDITDLNICEDKIVLKDRTKIEETANKWFNKNETELKNKYLEILDELIDTEFKVLEKIVNVQSKIEGIVYSVNTTNQLLNILPNAVNVKGIPSISVTSKPSTVVCEEINQLLEASF